MGQARKRGSYEERVQQSLARTVREQEEAAKRKRLKREEDQRWWDSLTPEQQEKELAAYRARKKRKHSAFLALAFGAALGARFW